MSGTINWNLLHMTGSTTRANTYVRKYTANSVRSGVLLNINNVPKAPKLPESLSETTSMNESTASTNTIQRKNPKARTKRTKKTPKTEASYAIKETQTIVEDSKQMRDFFDEVRQRQLKSYYHQMKVSPFSRECTRSSRMCLKCGLQKRTKKDPSQNVYCTGAESMRQSLRESDRNKDKDLTWLWSSTAAYPHLLLKCAYDSGGFKDKWSLPLFMSQKLKPKENPLSKRKWYL